MGGRGAAGTGSVSGTATTLASGGRGPTASGGTPSAGGGGASSGGTPSLGGNGNGGAVASGGMSMAGTGTCGFAPNPTGDRTKRRILLRDEGVSKLALVDLGNPTNGWVVPLQREQASSVQGRDMQLVGACRVMVGTDVGYEEYDLRNGAKLGEVTTFPGTVAAYRLRNKNTAIVGVGTDAAPFEASVGIVILELDTSAAIISKHVYPGTYARLVRQTSTGSFLIANNTRVVEGDANDSILPVTFDANKITNCNNTNPQFWKALRVPTTTATVTETVVATGYCASLAIFRSDGTLRTRITGGTGAIDGGATAVNPYFFSDFQLLSNGNYLVANWAGHGAGNFTKGIPVLEYTPAGALAWYWGDPAYRDVLSAIQGVILLDNLDLTKLHVEDTNGQQVPVN